MTSAASRPRPPRRRRYQAQPRQPLDPQLLDYAQPGTRGVVVTAANYERYLADRNATAESDTPAGWTPPPRITDTRYPQTPPPDEQPPAKHNPGISATPPDNTHPATTERRAP